WGKIMCRAALLEYPDHCHESSQWRTGDNVCHEWFVDGQCACVPSLVGGCDGFLIAHRKRSSPYSKTLVLIARPPCRARVNSGHNRATNQYLGQPLAGLNESLVQAGHVNCRWCE